ncbi:MAG: hypothetical protein HOE80_03440 [Candidatus Magasanikbacteria bacterium]|jgi:hypothetical protein|nr:hypothetical protein [Candidatus Magasanikbacteria bacterium]MBT4071751.1 hypothetical protein [Candidatus Magasanikbacteria bacterium]
MARKRKITLSRLKALLEELRYGAEQLKITLHENGEGIKHPYLLNNLDDISFLRDDGFQIEDIDGFIRFTDIDSIKIITIRG